MREIGIIADDLTGANDSGVQLTEKGINTAVFFDIPKEDIELVEGIVINTNSRSLSIEQAERKTNEAAAYLKDKGYRNIYKKMDSTIRGHVAEEVAAIYKKMQPDFVFIAPAYPALGRTTVDGTHYLHDKKIEETEISKDPVHPVLESHLPTLFLEVTNKEVATLTLEDVRSDFSTFRTKINKAREDEISFIVCDAIKETDLEQAAKYMSRISENVLWVGSAGLAEVLPKVLKVSNEVKIPQDFDTDQVLTICGSLSRVTQDQIKYAMSKDGITGIEISTVKVFDNEWAEYSEKIVKKGIEILNDSSDLVIYLPSHDKVKEEAVIRGKEKGWNETQISNIISGAVSTIAYEILKESDSVKGLVLTGGDTAKDTAVKLGGLGIQLIKQIETGIPLGTLIGPSKEYFVVTKAGAFGNTNSIYNAMLELKGVLDNE